MKLVKSSVFLIYKVFGVFPDGSAGKESACNAGDTEDAGLIPGLRRCPGGGNGNPLQYSCLINSMDGRAWRATVHRATKSRTQLSSCVHRYTLQITKKFLIAL